MIERKTITAQETAIYLGVSKDLIYSMVRLGEIPSVKIGRRILFRKEVLDRWIHAKEVKSQTEAMKVTCDTR